MASATVTEKLRPVRIGFLVDPADRGAIIRAIQLSSMLWGGMYNPIVPVFARKLPRRWSPHPFDRRTKPASITTGYLDGFDPDLVVCLGFDKSPPFELGNRNQISEQDLLGDFSNNGTPGFGVGVYEVAAHLAEKEFKYIRKDPLNVTLPQLSKAHHLFLASVFGSLPAEVASLVRTHLGKRLGLTEPKCSISNLIEQMAPENVFPRRIGILELRPRVRGAVVYCMDASNPLDVIDFWNLRAAGFDVIPAPTQLWKQPQLHTWIKDFIEQFYRPYRHNPEMYSHTTVQVGRSLDLSVVQQFVQSLHIPPGGSPTQTRLVTRPWYPRLWDRWARENTDERPEPPNSREREIATNEKDQNADLRTLDPPFELSFEFTGNVQYVNEIEYSVYGTDDPVAEVLPEGSKSLAGRIALGGFEE